MYQIFDKVIKFIKNVMENWWVEKTVRGKSLDEVKIQRGAFQGDALSPLQIVIAMMPLNLILRKCTGGYKLHKLKDKILYMDSIKLFAKNQKLNTGSKDI